MANVTGLWILQQCRAAWRDQGRNYSYGALVELAKQAPALRSLVDVGDPRFMPPGDYPALIQGYCRETGQPIPETHEAVARCVLESLALKYRQALDTLSGLTCRKTEAINVVGGGSQNELLNQLAADANGIPVTAGPVEATVLGNALVQLIALGEFKDLDEGRDVVARTGEIRHYEPRSGSEWAEAYERYTNPGVGSSPGARSLPA
jgi:sugar (pentulose or hexulose) kinase